MQDCLILLRENHKAFECTLNDSPVILSPDERDLRVSLMKEEILELVDAMDRQDKIGAVDGIVDFVYVLAGSYVAWGLYRNGGSAEDVTTIHSDLMQVANSKTLVQNMNIRIANILNELNNFPSGPMERIQFTLDKLYMYALQIILNMGIHEIFHELFAEVHRSNMTKLGLDGKPIKNEKGKYLKGPKYEKPDLKKIISKSKIKIFLN